MSWFTSLMTRLGHDEPAQSYSEHEGPIEANVAYENAKTALEEARRRREEARAVSSTLAQIRARNHFGESIELAMMPRRKAT